MFKLHLYTVSVEVNRVDKSSELSEDFTLNGTLKDDCSIIDPTIVVASDATIAGFNYAYVEEFKRYYFINDIVAMNNGMWELSMHVDVLMSFKDGLLKLPAWISRNEKEYNKLLSDTEVPILGVPTVTVESIGTGIFEGYQDPSESYYEVLLVFASNVIDYAHYDDKSFRGGIASMTQRGLNGEVLKSPSINCSPWNCGTLCIVTSKAEAAELLAKSQFTPELLDNLISIYAIPKFFIEPTRFGLQDIAAGVKLGIFGEMGVEDNTYSRILGFSISEHAYIARLGGFVTGAFWTFDVDSYLDLPPYCERVLVLPFAGEFAIPSNVLSADRTQHQIEIQIAVDWSNATIGYLIVVDDIYVGYRSGIFGTIVPIQRSDIGDIYARLNGVAISSLGHAVANIANIGGNIAGSFINGNIGRGVSSLFSGIGSAVTTYTEAEAEFARMVPSTAVEKGDSQYFNSFSTGHICLVTKRYKPTMRDDELNAFRQLRGSPLMDVRLLANMHGYTRVGDIHLEDFYATSVEKDEIDRKLKSGVILP